MKPSTQDGLSRPIVASPTLPSRTLPRFGCLHHVKEVLDRSLVYRMCRPVLGKRLGDRRRTCTADDADAHLPDAIHDSAPQGGIKSFHPEITNVSGLFED